MCEGEWMLTEKLRLDFDDRTRQRGQSYFSSGMVKIRSVGTGGPIVADVQGGELYRVTIGIKQRGRTWGLLAGCTCPYERHYGDCCKHVWATLLAVERSNTIYQLGPLPQKCYIEPVDGETDEYDGKVPASASTSSDSSSLRILKSASGGNGKRSAVPRKPGWKKLFNAIDSRSSRYEQPMRQTGGAALQPLYILELYETQQEGRLVISLAQQNMKKNGELGRPKKLSIQSTDILRMSDPRDRMICLMLTGTLSGQSSYGYYYNSSSGFSRWEVPNPLQSEILPHLFSIGRFYYRGTGQDDDIQPLVWDSAGKWELVLAFEGGSSKDHRHLRGCLRRGAERKPLSRNCVHVSGAPALFIENNIISEVDIHDCFDWLKALSSHQNVSVRQEDLPGMLKDMGHVSAIPPVEWPPDWGVTEVRDASPRPELTLHIPEASGNYQRNATGSLVFRYGDVGVQWNTEGRFAVDARSSAMIHRTTETEKAMIARLFALGAKQTYYTEGFEIPQRLIPSMVSSLLSEGWDVIGNEKLYRRPGEFNISVSSGIDWFDLEGKIKFDDQEANLPELLAALKKGDKFVRLGDGTLGMLPQEWLARHGAFLEMGRAEDGHVRFAKTQIGLIDALLGQMPEARFDASVHKARQKINSFSGIAPCAESAGFVGELRAYQREGLGWLGFLKEFGWGGCLADDMGLGKTIQVLALLARHKREDRSGPSLVVAPKSLIFNWQREAARFAPELRVLDYTGLERKNVVGEIEQSDLVLTTYGTLLRDIEQFTKQRFDYVFLDEAQAVKNPNAQSAKAVRLLQAGHRLALTGTPVENHLGDLWSIFEFLNPGMLGGMESFKAAFANGRGKDAEPERLNMLSRMLRPFILRRTKAQVAPELPERNEQTIECEMCPKQTAYYDELRDYYRKSLLARVEKNGLARSKIQVLEALLRLRQAACHPGLIDGKKKLAESTKLESLVPMLTELAAEGHKALVFSQFVKFLDLLRPRLDKLGMTYEYLDGKTQDRARRVDRFQNDAKCPLFLVSLKAGGVGLNLTAADYVFILDPWWNPAVEAQAIDRTHRIGQTKKVIAYRLIARDTVEAKILELQRSKRALADAIISENNSLIRTLTRDDLNLLLS
jgi:superfamily II DNA or RNA helicase